MNSIHAIFVSPTSTAIYFIDFTMKITMIFPRREYKQTVKYVAVVTVWASVLAIKRVFWTPSSAIYTNKNTG